MLKIIFQFLLGNIAARLIFKIMLKSLHIGPEEYYKNFRGGSFRPNRRKPEGRILLTIRPNREAEFDRKAENISSLISASYINIFICYKNHLVYHNVLIEKVIYYTMRVSLCPQYIHKV